jgi:hypothetical protein
MLKQLDKPVRRFCPKHKGRINCVESQDVNYSRVCFVMGRGSSLPPSWDVPTSTTSGLPLALNLPSPMNARHSKKFLNKPHGLHEILAASSVQTQQSWPFLNLPRELRDEIYTIVLPSHTTVNFSPPTWELNAVNRFVDVQHDMSPHCLTILSVNQQIRAEASAILYGTNHFKFYIGISSISRYWGPRFPSPYNTVRALPHVPFTFESPQAYAV